MTAAWRAPLAALLLTPGGVPAQAWVFDTPIAVTGAGGEGVFHHLESSGRRNVAVSGGTVAVVWEDNRDGTPRIYLARQGAEDGGFAQELRLSGGGEAFEPSVVGAGGGRFVVAWEEDGAVLARVVDPRGTGPTLRLHEAAGAQASLAAAPGEVLAFWSGRSGRFGRIRMARLAAGPDGTLSVLAGCPVEPAPPAADQLYPAAAVVGGRAVVAWEDRRRGHTVIMSAVSDEKQPCGFGRPQRVSEDPPGPQMPYGKGHGVSRVAVAAHGEDGLLAAWADKRNFREGYDVYAAEYVPAEERFGGNARVQDAFGGLARQWHVAVAGGPGAVPVVAWDDDRDGAPDVMLSWPAGGGWSDDMPLPGASGPGEQTHPAITLDARGDLHAAWVEREYRGGPTRLRYAVGRAAMR
jgi:hypothetical protein